MKTLENRDNQNAIRRPPSSGSSDHAGPPDLACLTVKQPPVSARSGPRRPRNAIVELQVAGPIPSKKNSLKLTRGGHAYYPAEVKSAMESIRLQLGKQWIETVVTDSGPVECPRPPIANPAMAFVFYVSKQGLRSDRDGKLVTVLDELVNVGVIRDDSISSWNGPCLMASAVTTDGWAGARIFIDPKANLGKLWRHVQTVPNLMTCRLQKPVAGGFRFAAQRRSRPKGLYA